jgi:hypothetical protein
MANKFAGKTAVITGGSSLEVKGAKPMLRERRECEVPLSDARAVFP